MRDETRWRHDGVRVVRAGELDLNTAQTPGMTRAATPPPKPSLQDITGAEAQTGVAGEGSFVAWLALRSPMQANDWHLTNRPFDVLWQALMRRELASFGAP